MPAKITTLFKSNANDVAAMLRRLADAFERGEHPDDACYCIIPKAGTHPDIYAFGKEAAHPPTFVWQMQLAMAWTTDAQLGRI